MLLAAPVFQKAIERLSAAKRLTLIVGAGVSTESGLPTWNALVSDLLRDAIDVVDPELDANAVEQLIDWLVETDGLPGAGSIVQSALGGEFVPTLRRRLYGEPADELVPGPTAHQIARLLKVAGPAVCEVLTTNYDILLETALNQDGVPLKKIKRYVVSRSPRSSDVYVFRHLHGILTPTQQQGKIVLSDADYYRMQAPTRWQEKHTRKRLEQSTCLFLGTSLSDPNLVRYVYRSAPTEANTVLFVRQGDERAFSSLPGVRQAREVAADLRWKEGGILPLYADYFVEVAQFIYELAAARVARAEGSAAPDFASRMHCWFQEMRSGILQIDDVGGFRAVQDGLQNQLESTVAVVRELIAQAGVRAPGGEQLGLHLWVIDPTANALTLWASSDRAWRDPHTLTPVPVTRPTDWVAVEAFCRGTPVSQSTEDDRSSRWNHVLGVPVRLDADPEDLVNGSDRWGLLPVGVLTLASSEPSSASSIGQLDRGAAADLVQLLASVGSELLRPE